MTDSASLRNFLEIPYDQLEEMNLEAKRMRIERVEPANVEADRRKYLVSTVSLVATSRKSGGSTSRARSGSKP